MDSACRRHCTQSMNCTREIELDRITVKIRNMKRSGSKDSPRFKRRGSLSRYEDSSDETMSTERSARRKVVRTPSPRQFITPQEEYKRSSAERHAFKVLCVSALNPKASDEYIKDTLYREYKKFGDFSIRVAHDLDERVAYICFRTPEDAREAKQQKPRLTLYDKIAVVEPVYEASFRNDMRSLSRPLSPLEFDRRFYSRSPNLPPTERRRLPVDSYERYGPAIINVQHSREFRPLHHEYMPRGPPIHHVPHHMHHPPHPHYMPRHLVARPHAPYEKQENKKDKFPNYLHHVQPEDDPLATRTLFAGNLEINISDEELRRIFGKYGIVEDIDIKRPPPGTGNAFAFVRYQNLDMAHRAKLELSGQYIGKFQCKIGYGKATPTTRIWVGGLGGWTSVTQLEREFDRFGAIKKIEYQKGDTCAYITYETIEAAAAAVKDMRGFSLGGPERRLRIDFSDVTSVSGVPFRTKQSQKYDEGFEYRRPEFEFHEPKHYDDQIYSGFIHRGTNRGRGYRRGTYRGGFHDMRSITNNVLEDNWPRFSHNMTEIERGRSPSRDVAARSRSRSPIRRSPDSDSDSSSRKNNVGLFMASTLSDIAKKSSILWQGALILKSSLFPAKLHLTDGDVDIVDSLMKDEDGKHNLRITQRLRLDPPKLDDVQKRISSSSSHAIFLGLSTSATVQGYDSNAQSRPLRNLVTYLKQKEAAGVISLLNKETEATGVLYAFPPCKFSTELLKRTCHTVSEESLKEDHLVIVVVRGATT